MKLLRFNFPILLLISVILYSCGGQANKNQSDNTADDFIAQWIDTSTSPGSDFFRYATGNWMKNNPIPDAERRWGIGNLVQEEVFSKLKALSEDAAKDEKAPEGSNRQRIGAFWSSAMDSATIESLGIKPLNEELARIEAITDLKGIREVVSRQQVVGCSPMFDFAPYQDEMNSESVSLHLYQGGLGLPDRDYYFIDDSRNKNIREEYVKHIANMLTLSGMDGKIAAAASKDIMKLETSLAGASRKLEDLRDPYANYNKLAVSQFNAANTNIDLRYLLDAMGLQKVDTVVIGQPE
ncbi:MAG: M13 family peptidase, partial [Bacteroidota bacterium]